MKSALATIIGRGPMPVGDVARGGAEQKIDECGYRKDRRNRRAAGTELGSHRHDEGAEAVDHRERREPRETRRTRSPRPANPARSARCAQMRRRPWPAYLESESRVWRSSCYVA